MNEKKSLVITIAVTALVSSLLTSVVRDVVFIKAGGEGLQKISAVKNMLTEYSLYEVDEEKVSDYASMAMAAAVDDPYTAYYPAEEFSSYRDNLVSSYVGIGALIGIDAENDRLVVVSCFEDSPADKAGLKSGDVLLEIDGEVYNANQLTEAAVYMKSGEVGSTLKVVVEREGKGTLDIEITRDAVIKKSVKSEMITADSGYIRITGFESKSEANEKDTYDEFCEHLEGLKSAGMKKLIIDLRDNPGGDLNVVCKMADKLLPEGLITYTEDKRGKRETINSDKEEINMPMVVLVNGGSASASEVLTGALKDHNKATIVGETTFGKGIVQTVYPFSDGSGMSITTAKYYTPKGVCIHDVGIEPDVFVELDSDKRIAEMSHSEDTQLKKAIEIISQ